MASAIKPFLKRLKAMINPSPEESPDWNLRMMKEISGSRDSKTFAHEETLSPCRFRFLDVKRYLNEELIYVREFSELPKSKYAALSYVWRGLRPQPGSTSSAPSFTIQGAEDADPINSGVLHTACLAALHFKCDLLWIDRLSVIQTSKEDKTWQIKNMFTVYQLCKVCLVLPGGLAKLAGVTEVTPWIHRAWTLQESVAPPSVQVVFHWTLGSCTWQHTNSILVEEVEPQTAAVASLEEILTASMAHGECQIIFPGRGGEQAPREFRPTILSDGNEAGQVHHITTLLGALTQDETEGRMNAIWRATLLRTSSRPVDMVFSIMGLLGVNLDPNSFDDDDRQKATIRLLQELMKKGYGAEWLGLAPNVRTPAGLSTIPMMPKTSVAGRAFVDTAHGEKEVSTILENDLRAMWWWLDGAPTGSIDDLGNLTTKARAIPISKYMGPEVELEYRQETHPDIVVDYSTTEGWSLKPSTQDANYALNLGQKRFYRHGFLGKVFDPNPTLLMLLGRKSVNGKAGNKIVGFAWGDEALAQDWPMQEFTIFA